MCGKYVPKVTYNQESFSLSVSLQSRTGTSQDPAERGSLRETKKTVTPIRPTNPLHPPPPPLADSAAFVGRCLPKVISPLSG